MWWELEEETYPPAPTPWLPPCSSTSLELGSQLSWGRLHVAGVGHWLPRTRTLPTSTDSVWPAQGVFVCVCSSLVRSTRCSSIHFKQEER